MKRLAYLTLLTLVLVSCGSRRGYFKLEGRLLNLNQGEFYVYSPDGVFDGVDTIKVEGGRFTYETPCKDNGTLVIIFPNFSEQPVFAEPGENVTIKGDASHLKEIEVKGTDENELMNAFRRQIADASPPEVTAKAEEFIKNNPESAVSVYILRKYFITDDKADLNRAGRLAGLIYKAQPKNGHVARIVRYIDVAKHGVQGSAMPSFSEKDIDGRTVSTADTRGKVAVVFTFASWSQESMSMKSMLNRLKKDNKDRMMLIGISMDASRKTCKETLRFDSLSASVLCDQQLFDSPLLAKFALQRVPDAIVYDTGGRIVAHGLGSNELEAKLKTMLNR